MVKQHQRFTERLFDFLKGKKSVSILLVVTVYLVSPGIIKTTKGNLLIIKKEDKQLQFFEFEEVYSKNLAKGSKDFTITFYFNAHTDSLKKSKATTDSLKYFYHYLDEHKYVINKVKLKGYISPVELTVMVNENQQEELIRKRIKIVGDLIWAKLEETAHDRYVRTNLMEEIPVADFWTKFKKSLELLPLFDSFKNSF